jgi:hypothetical protein
VREGTQAIPLRKTLTKRSPPWLAALEERHSASTRPSLRHHSMEACGEGYGLLQNALRGRTNDGFCCVPGWRHVTLKSQGLATPCHVEDSLTGRPDAPKFILPVPNSEEGTLLKIWEAVGASGSESQRGCRARQL